MAKEQPNKFRELSRTRFQRAFELCKVYNRKIYLTELLVAFGMALLVVAMVRHQTGNVDIPVLEAQDLAPRTIRAHKTLEFEDKAESESLRLEIIKKVIPVYDHDVDAADRWSEAWKIGIRELRERDPEFQTNPRGVLSQKLGVEVSAEEFAALKRLKYSKELEASISYTLGPLWGQRIVENSGLGTTPIDVIQLRNDKSERLTSEQAKSMMNIEEARQQILKVLRSATRRAGGAPSPPVKRMSWLAWQPKDRELIFALHSRLVRATVTLNSKETEKRREEALKSFRPAMTRLQKGEVIVREGERVSPKASRVLEQLTQLESKRSYSSRILFEAIFATFAFWIVVVFLRRQYPKILSDNKDNFVTCMALLTSLASFKLAALFQLNVIADHFTRVPAELFLFMIPVAAPAMILKFLVQPSLAVLFSVFYALGCALILEGAPAFGAHVLLSCLMGGAFLRRCRTRNELYLAGMKTAVISAFSAVAIVGAWGGQAPLSTSVFLFNPSVHFGWATLVLWAFVGGLVGGWLSSVMTLILTPPLENVLDYTTDLRLLELARMDHPLLRDLVLKAPGTYHHSIIVGSLAEAACEAIGANALLSRVGSYYHDVGKIHRAEYFVENQSHGFNPHDNNRPQLSAKIIISHVKEGKVLAEQHKLGQKIVDFILQHHGNSLVSYFYNKAKQEAAQPDSNMRPEDIDEEEFRYPGPKPQSKEAAVMALADGCEAATRSLVDPTPARIEAMIRKIINRSLSENLLDEADITLREIHLVERAFLRILLGIHHNRIQYPDQEKDLPKASTINFSKIHNEK